MTQEMLRIILRLALTKLMELSPATLKGYEPWIKRKHIRWCLDHISELTLDQESIEELHKIREMLAITANVELVGCRGARNDA